jgi:MgtE intracellular N domain
VLVLSRTVHQPVRVRQSVVGRLRDLTVRLDSPHPIVERLAVGTRRRTTLLVPWETVADLGPTGVRLRDATSVESYAVDELDTTLADDEIALRRDLLDSQIVDVRRQRMARVSDVYLNWLPAGQLEVAAVDVGMAALLRRLGQHRIASRYPDRAVDLADLYLTSARGHSVQLATRSPVVHQLDARGLAELLARLDVERATDVLQAVGPGRAAEAVESSHPAVGTRLMLALSPAEAAPVLDELPPDRARHFRMLRARPRALTSRRLKRHAGWRVHHPPPKDPKVRNHETGPQDRG